MTGITQIQTPETDTIPTFDQRIFQTTSIEIFRKIVRETILRIDHKIIQTTDRIKSVIIIDAISKYFTILKSTKSKL